MLFIIIRRTYYIRYDTTRARSEFRSVPRKRVKTCDQIRRPKIQKIRCHHQRSIFVFLCNGYSIATCTFRVTKSGRANGNSYNVSPEQTLSFSSSHQMQQSVNLGRPLPKSVASLSLASPNIQTHINGQMQTHVNGHTKRVSKNVKGDIIKLTRWS